MPSGKTVWPRYFSSFWNSCTLQSRFQTYGMIQQYNQDKLNRIAYSYHRDSSPWGAEKSLGHLTSRRAFCCTLKTRVADGKCCLLFISFLHLYLPVCALNVKAAEPTSAVQWVKHFIYLRQCICISLGLRIQLSEVDTEPNLTIRLANQDHWARIRTLRYPDSMKSKHLL